MAVGPTRWELKQVFDKQRDEILQREYFINTDPFCTILDFHGGGYKAFRLL
jgi:hypothetical protein